MLICISPAKTLDESPQPKNIAHTTADFLSHSDKLIRKLNRTSLKKIKALMGLSDNLAKQNQERYANFRLPFTSENAKQCVLMFKGDVYEGLKADDFSSDDLDFAQRQLRILSGLYGILKPLDLIQPYRLEMGTTFSVGRKRNLYQFWGSLISDHLNKSLMELDQDVLINLASIEYFKAVDQKKLHARIITPHFKEERNGEFTMISFFAKKARGLLSRYIIKNQITDPNEITSFDLEGYRYNPRLSSGDGPVFTRRPQPI